MRYRALLVGLLLASSISWLTVTALAEEDRPGRADRRTRMLERHPEADTNEDGELSDEEIKAFFKNNKPLRDGMGHGPRHGGPGRHGWKGGAEKMLEMHPEADTDGDGQLSPEERRAFMETRRAEMTKGLLAAHPDLDKDGDGELSYEERKAGRETIEAFTRTQMSSKILVAHPEADTDGDGKLSEEEFAAVRRGGRGPGHPGMGPDKMVQWLIDHFDEVDTNSDGQLSKEELTQFKDSLPEFGPPGPGHKGFGAHKAKGAKHGGKDKGESRGRKHRKGKPKDADNDSDEK